MSSFITFSAASSIGIHSIVMIARSEKPINAAQLAEAMGCSSHHVAKIMLQLTRLGFIDSKRGLHGGFSLVRPLETISLLDIYEALEGPLEESSCIAPSKVCPFNSCLLCGIKKQMNNDLATILKSKTLDMLMDEDPGTSIAI